MTSDQIRDCDWLQAAEHNWPREIAYQLAVMNERNAAQLPTVCGPPNLPTKLDDTET